MSITSELNRTAALATDGVETEFDFSLLIHAESELQVWYKATGGSYSQLTLNSHYTIEFNSSGGTVTTIGSSSPYAAGEILLIRHLPITQLTNWLYNDNHSEEAHQDDFDRSVMRDLQIQEQLDRCVGFNITSGTTGIEFPEPVADKMIGWNSVGTTLENKTPESAFVIGITDGNVLSVDGSPNSGEYARFTANGLEGRTVTENRDDLGLGTGDSPTFAGGTIYGGAFKVGGLNDGLFLSYGGTGGVIIGMDPAQVGYNDVTIRAAADGTGVKINTDGTFLVYGNITAPGMTITGNSVFGLNSSVFQPTTDSTTFFQILDADGGTPIFNVDSTNERVGFGENSPDGIIHTKTPDSSNIPIFERSGRTSNIMWAAANFLATKTTSMGNNFGSGMFFSIRDDADVINFIGGVGAVRDGADNSGAIIFQTFIGGVAYSRLELTSNGNVNVGTSPVGSFERRFNVRDEGVSGAARISLFGTAGKAIPPGLEMSINGDGNKRILIRLAEEGSNDYGIDIFTTNNSTVGQVMKITGNGYLGIGEVAPETFTEWTSTVPYLTLHNSTHEDTDGGRESRINFKGEQSGGEETTLARIEVSHDGVADDEKGKLVISVNDGNDGDSPTQALEIGSDLLATFAGAISCVGFTSTDTVYMIKEGAGAYGYITTYRTHSLAGGFVMQHARGTKASPTVLLDNDYIGFFYFQGYDSNSFENFAWIAARANGTPADGDTPGELLFATTPSGSVTSLLRVKIDAAGNTYIGDGGATNYAKIEADGDIVQHGSNRFIESSKFKITSIGGYAVKLTNKTGANSVSGQLIKADTATDDAVVLAGIGDTECFGVFLDSGIADASEAWVVVSGIADVALDDNVAAVRGNWMATGAAAGYARTSASPAASPQHFEEIGHCIESVAAGGAGTHALARCILHFN